MHHKRRGHGIDAIASGFHTARRRALVTVVAAAASVTTGGSVPSPVAAQTLPAVNQTVAQILEIPGGLSPRLLKMIEEEGFLCVLAFHPVPPGISWVCTPLP